MKSQIAQTPGGSSESTLSGTGPAALVWHGASSDCFPWKGNFLKAP